MNFSDVINKYIELLNCSGKEIAVKAGLSQSIISRYRKAQRVPKDKAGTIAQLSKAIAALADEKGIGGADYKTVYDDFSSSFGMDADAAEAIKNINRLFDSLDINNIEIARAVNYDASHISRIRTGQRTPSNIEKYVNDVDKYIVKKYSSEENKATVASIIGCEVAELSGESEYLSVLNSRIFSKNIEVKNEVGDFLKSLDEFNLDEFITAIKFDKMKVPSVPFTFPTSKNYYGLEKIKAAELDFFKATVFSKSREKIFMCSDMPMEDMAQDKEFSKKWMFGLAMMLKKGLTLTMVHNVNRPFNEMMLGLESWIPMYMTGQIEPYYLNTGNANIYGHLNYVSGGAAMCGECVVSHHDEAKYYLTKNREEINYYRKKCEFILGKASPLMDIYRSDSAKEFKMFLIKSAAAKQDRKNTLTSFPIYTLSETLLKKILCANSLSKEESNEITAYFNEARENAEHILQDNKITDEISVISEEEFRENPVNLSLSEIFFSKDVFYTYKDYSEHLKLTQEYEKQHENYTFRSVPNAFRSIQIHIIGRQVLVSKDKFPVIHFLIKHKQLCSAIENMIIPIKD